VITIFTTVFLLLFFIFSFLVLGPRNMIEFQTNYISLENSYMCKI
jgi:hypothetical protein